jgi:hypothetical protein
MDVRDAAVFAGIFRVHPPAMAEGAGPALVLADEFVSFEKPDINAPDDGALYVAVPAGCMTAPAGLFEYFSVEGFRFVRGKPGRYAPHASGRIVEG